MKKILFALLIVAILMSAMLFVACDDPDEPDEPDTPDHVHTYSDTVVDPTCISGGYTLHTCTECGYKMRDTFTSASSTNHSYTIETFDATCTEDAYTVKTCEYCGDQIVNVKKGTAGHEWGDWEITAENTCTDWGLEERWCNNCDAHEENPIEPEHFYELTVIQPTCTENGTRTYTCTNCGHTYTENGDKALGHDMSDWTIVREHTCTDHGEMERHCTREDCTYSETKEESSELHFYEYKETVEPTEATHGYELWECTECGKTVIKNITHNFTEWHACPDSSDEECRECTSCGCEEHRTAA